MKWFFFVLEGRKYFASCKVLVSKFPQFYDKIKNKYQFIPRPYGGSYSGEKGHIFLQEKWILSLSKSVETFLRCQ